MKYNITKKNIYLLLLLVVALLGVVITPTYAKFSSNYETDDDVVGMSLDFSVKITDIEEYEEIEIESDSYEVFNVNIENITSNTMYYGIWYRMIIPEEITTDITIARVDGTDITTSGSLTSNEAKTISIIILNKSDSPIKINIGIASSDTSVDNIEYLNGRRLITGTAKVPVNEPNLDDGNLIPVYYDNETEVWKKADSTNTDNSWYDYYNKMWANAILVSDETARSTYQSAEAGTTITDSDITAFYVWIPRFKYHVWNITRQGGDESTYAYSAYSKGIDIHWEKGTESTGNVKCTYDSSVAASDTNLSDTCVVNGTATITTTSGNTNYPNAWYTHPAFTFGDKELTGFWIGKFETTGDTLTPTILPDLTSLRTRIVSNDFTSSKVFQNYGLSSNIDSHLLTNLEWGAVSYLTHSMFGLCDGTSCRGLYQNNSSGYYTGRSGGDVSGSDALQLTNVYGSDTTTSTTTYNSNGYYTYKGYFIDYSGNITTTKDESKVASTTGNVTGVYDMSGGAHDAVMGNMVNSSNEFYPVTSGTDWNGTSTLDSKYYNSYSYGTTYNDVQAFNRTRLGDATAETLGTSSGDLAGWQPGIGITGASTNAVYWMFPWFHRGGNYSSSDSEVFNFNRDNGFSYANKTFRCALS